MVGTCVTLSSHLSHGHMQAIYAKSKAMDVLESDIEYHFTGLGLRQQVVDPNSMKRLHRAQLPVQDSERVSDMIGKVAGIAKSRQDMKAVRGVCLYSILGDGILN